ncbi:hypothetical protein P8625_00360 [Tenacibaculum tangerinum]|uniref:Uncharacterized protein n=1 Tax=Tenacibaculum tangerinum TaxID=3038772 RepID=A0ABY8L311_9FLAO|nr:hypothetical protein [Tenacibaculum tangerinum]WGH75649.1 hypothetical protein P8625_00360 [Tenacibaculum tangerinum]
MRNLLLTLILIGNYLTSFAQDNFANALVSLNSKLEFKPTSDSYKNGKKPDENFIKQFKKCAEFDKLEKLTELSFDKITKVKSSELFTSKWKGKWQIEFQEWEFEQEKYASDFINLLDDLDHSRVQFCVSKGGIMWWKDNDKIYLVTSRAYFVTYHYAEIKNAIINGLKK